MPAFTVTAIKQQATDIKEKAENYRCYTNDMIKCLDYISPKVASEDSDLSRKISEVAETYRGLYTDFTEKFQNLALIMETYCQKTEANEETAASGISAITKANQSLLDTINSLIRKWGL